MLADRFWNFVKIWNYIRATPINFSALNGWSRSQRCCLKFIVPVSCFLKFCQNTNFVHEVWILSPKCRICPRSQIYACNMWRQIFLVWQRRISWGESVAIDLVASWRGSLMLKWIKFARASMKFSRSNFMHVRQPLNSACSRNKSVKLGFKPIYLPQMGILSAK